MSKRRIRTLQVLLCVTALLSAAAAGAAGRPGGAAASGAAAPPAQAPGAAALVAQARMLFAAGNAFWSQFFIGLGGHYPPPMLVFFERRLAGVCGMTQPLSGPFYCPDNQVVYLDSAFLQQAQMQTAGNDDAALAYVIGHELAHHVQNLVGTTAVVDQARSRSTPALSARTWMAEELQADCYAGLWMQTAMRAGQIHLADPAALLEGVAAVSHDWQAHLPHDETLPDPVLSYGSMTQRLEWFRHGLTGKGFADCDTFSAESAGKL